MNPDHPFWRPLLITNLASASFAAGSAWLAQANWMLWRHVGPDTFPAYHTAWWHSVWWAIFPVAGISFLGVVAQVVWRPPTAPGLVGFALALQVIGAAGAAAWWGPQNARLGQVFRAGGAIDPRYTLLTTTNWVRVAVYTAVALLEFGIALRALGARHQAPADLAA